MDLGGLAAYVYGPKLIGEIVAIIGGGMSLLGGFCSLPTFGLYAYRDTTAYKLNEVAKIAGLQVMQANFEKNKFQKYAEDWCLKHRVAPVTDIRFHQLFELKNEIEKMKRVKPRLEEEKKDIEDKLTVSGCNDPVIEKDWEVQTTLNKQARGLDFNLECKKRDRRNLKEEILRDYV